MEGRKVTHDLTLGEENSEVFAVRWSADDALLAASMGDGSIRLFSATNGSLIRQLNCRVSGENMPVTGIRWRPLVSVSKTKHILLSVTSDGGIIHWHATSGKELHKQILPGTQCLACDFSKEGTMYAVGCQDMFIRIFDEATKAQTYELSQGIGERIGHSNRIFSVKWVSDNLIASAGWDNNILLWDLRSQSVVRSIFGPHVCGDALDVRGDMLVSGSFSSVDQLEFWNVLSGENEKRKTLQQGDVPCQLYAVQYSKHDGGRTLAAGGAGAGECYFFDSDSLQLFSLMTHIPGAVFSIDHAHTEPRVAIGCGDGTIRIATISNS